MRIIEIFSLILSISLIGLIFVRTPLKMARVETNTNQTLDNTIIIFTFLYITTVLFLKCW
jgi:hypothetical protein